MKTEIAFWLKVIRNGGILAGLYFFSVWTTTQELSFLIHLKPILIFMGTYILTEAVKRYQLDFKTPNKFKENCTLIY